MEERQKNVDEFYAFDGPALLILNPKTAGTCLNITEAKKSMYSNLLSIYGTDSRYWNVSGNC